MEIEIRRGYEILPNNNLVFGMRITNNTDSVISDMQVILEYNESLFEYQGDRIQKLENIPPNIPRTVKFILKPLSCVHKENIEATITYRDHKWEKHIVSIRPKEVHCVCPFLRPKPMDKGEFLHLFNTGHAVENGIAFHGISSVKLIEFLRQTCTTRLYEADCVSIGKDKALYFSGESIGERSYYLLTALIKESDDMVQVLFRAISDKQHGINGFLNEIVMELKHLVNTVNSAKEIGMIKHEQVINIIDSVVQRSNITNGTDSGPVNIKDSVIQRTEVNSKKYVPDNLKSSSITNDSISEEEIENAYVANIEEIKEKHAQARKKKIGWDEDDPRNQLNSRQNGYDERGSLYSALRLDESDVKKRRFDLRVPKSLILLALVISAYLWISPLIGTNSNGEETISPVDSYLVESKVTKFLNAVNEGKTGEAFAMYYGKDFLAPASIPMMFSNKGIEQGSIKDIVIVSKNVAGGQAVVTTSCNVSAQDLSGNEKDGSYVPVYFRLQKAELGWIITRVSFYTPLVIETYDTYITDVNPGQQSTGKQATQTVSSNLMVKNIEGVRAKNSYGDMSDTIDLLKLKVGLNVGSSPVDMENVVISITDGTRSNVLVYAGKHQSGNTMESFSTSSAALNLGQLITGRENPEKYYVLEKIRDEDNSFTQGNPVMNTGDLVTLYIATIADSSTGYTALGSSRTAGLASSGLELTPRTVVNIVLTPESGAATTADFVTPSSYGVKETVALYP